MEDFKHFDYASYFLQECQRVAIAMKQPQIDQFVVNQVRTMKQAPIENHPNYLQHTCFISFTPKSSKPMDFLSVTEQQKPVIIRKFQSVCNSKFQLIPNFYSQQKQKTVHNQIHNALTLSREMTHIALEQLSCNRNFINPYILTGLLEEFKQNLNRHPETLKLQLRRANNLITQFVVDPRLISSKITDFLISIVISMELSVDDIDELCQILIRALALLYTYQPTQVFTRIHYICQEMKQQEQLAEVFVRLYDVDFFYIYSNRILKQWFNDDNGEQSVLDKNIYDILSKNSQLMKQNIISCK
ncbi:Hypothetical_protein [Hexamita inflata]|uniref:Hypothetical_protein n=1 Tax=Hexamita inflata TaxID=28002 RepID=A0ABP1GX42_9EUKA